MRTRTALVATLAAMFAVACAPQRPISGGSADAARAPLEARQAAFFAAVAARDADRVAAFFAGDAVLQVANMPPVSGRSAIRTFYGNMFGFMTASSNTPDALEISRAGDMAYGIGRSSNEFRGPDGPVTYAGKYTLVWRRLAGEWLIVLYAVSSNQPTP